MDIRFPPDLPQGARLLGGSLEPLLRVLLELSNLAIDGQPQASREVLRKEDGSPVTDFDVEIDRRLRGFLLSSFPEIPILSEEISPKIPALRESPRRFFLVDPIDGTYAYVQGSREYTLNVALIEDNLPVFGAVSCPGFSEVYLGGRFEAGWQSFLLKEKEAARGLEVSAQQGGTRVICSKRNEPEVRAFAFSPPACEFLHSSSSRKFCLIAKGEADAYLSLGGTRSWDVAAGAAVLLGAGGALCMMDAQLRKRTFEFYASDRPNGVFLASSTRGIEVRRGSPQDTHQ